MNIMTAPKVGTITEEISGYNRDTKTYVLRAWKLLKGKLYFCFSYVYPTRQDAEKRAKKYGVTVYDPQELETLRKAGEDNASSKA